MPVDWPVVPYRCSWPLLVDPGGRWLDGLELVELVATAVVTTTELEIGLAGTRWPRRSSATPLLWLDGSGLAVAWRPLTWPGDWTAGGSDCLESILAALVGSPVLPGTGNLVDASIAHPGQSRS
jgi:hypothetical protein